MSKILVVDDERGIRESLDIFLSDEGHAIDTAANGREAILLLKKHQYDLVLTDVRMPDMNGIVLMKEIKEKMHQPIPVIVLTNLEGTKDVEKALDLGAKTYLVKANYELEEVVNKIKDTLK